jgi:hypothetical protein
VRILRPDKDERHSRLGRSRSDAAEAGAAVRGCSAGDDQVERPIVGPADDDLAGGQPARDIGREDRVRRAGGAFEDAPLYDECALKDVAGKLHVVRTLTGVLGRDSGSGHERAVIDVRVEGERRVEALAAELLSRPLETSSDER